MSVVTETETCPFVRRFDIQVSDFFRVGKQHIHNVGKVMFQGTNCSDELIILAKSPSN